MKKLIAVLLLLALALASVPVFAEGKTVSFSGTVTAKQEVPVLADKHGKVSALNVSAGDRVENGAPILALATEKIYSPVDGKVSLICCRPGDASSAVIDRYGALMYVEDQYSYEVWASIDSAYNSVDNKLVHPGETVWVQCGDNKHYGSGLVSKIDGNEYRVLISSGKLIIGESVNVYRGSEARRTGNNAGSVDSTSRIGKGVVQRITPYGITGTGNIVNVFVSEGDAVSYGDVLCEIIDAGVNGFSENMNRILASASGIVGEIRVNPGDEVNKSDVIAVIYPTDAVVVKGYVSEFEVRSLNVGDPVEVEVLSTQDETKIYPGRITSVARSSSKENRDAKDGAVTFGVTVEFDAEDALFYGMSVIVNVVK